MKYLETKIKMEISPLNSDIMKVDKNKAIIKKRVKVDDILDIINKEIIIVENGSLLSHLSIISRELGIPYIVIEKIPNINFSKIIIKKNEKKVIFVVDNNS